MNVSVKQDYLEIVEAWGDEYAYRQLAEEAVELAQAALKMVRALRHETPLPWERAEARLVEELADAQVMIDLVRMAVLDDTANVSVQTMMGMKRARMVERLLNRRKEDGA